MTYPDSNDYLTNITDDYRPPHVRHADRVVEMFRNEPLSVCHKVPMDIVEPPRIDPLNEIASLMRRLTYGQMVELGAGIGVPADVIHCWAQKMP